jgi:uncharacterized protein YjiS (DUF1127 family)
MTGRGTDPSAGNRKDTKMASIATYEIGLSGWEGLVARVRKGLDDYRLYRATLDELGSLSDRELADLGISRLSIRDIARESVYGL